MVRFGWLCLLAILTVFLLTPLSAEVVSAQTTTAAVSPSTKSVENGQSFSIEIVVTPDTSIAGAQFDLSFDPSLLTVTSVQEGNLFSQGGASTYFQSGAINNTAGTVTGVASVILGPNTVSSPGTLAIVHFTAKNVAGTSSLTLSNVIVGNENGEAVPILLTGGSVQVTFSGENAENTGGGENQGGSGTKLVYDDFNDGEHDTNLGGLAGSMSPDELHDPIVDFTSAAAEGAYALSLTYDFPSGQWCGYWSFANDDDPQDNVKQTIDVSSYAYLRFYLKGAVGGEKFKMELNDSVFDSSSTESYLTTQNHRGQVYVQATNTWQDVEIPLSDFTNQSLDLSDLRQINIVFDKPPRSGTVYIDKIRFTDGTGADDNQGGGDNEGGPSNIRPIAYIDFIEYPAIVYENTGVVFSGHGVDPDGAIMGCLWTSSIDGPLSTLSTFDTVDENIVLSPGTHQIRFKVRDDEGLWSNDATAQLIVTSSLVAGGPTSGLEQTSEGSSRGSNENVVILLVLEAAAIAALVSFIAIKKFGYLEPAAEFIHKTKGGAKPMEPTIRHIHEIKEPIEPAGVAMEHISEIKEPPMRKFMTPKISLRDLAKEVSSSKIPKYKFGGQMPDIPKEKWSELKMRLRRLMNSRRKLL